MDLSERILEKSNFYISFLSRDIANFCWTGQNRGEITVSEHLDTAAQWICRAQDATPDDGVARSYSLIYHPYFKRKGWFPSYPETTGYIIPTIFDYAYLTKRQDLHDRAVRMAEWEIAVQMENGAVQGGTVENIATPAVFNTGQVIFGWIRAFQETRKEQFINAASKAGNFLINNQEDDGSWRKNLSDYAGKQMPFYTYNTRTAWALYLLGSTIGKAEFIDAALNNIDFSLTQQNDNGWFQNNCLTNPEQPLLHTIAYTTRGLLETGILSGNSLYSKRAKKAADALIPNIRMDGSLAGRFDANWRPMVDWSCLTGNAQFSVIYGKLYQVFHDLKYLELMKRINGYLRRKQLRSPSNKNLHGGICGSYPIYGEYGKFEILNWAVKFFMDALMLEQAINSSAPINNE